MPRGAEEPCPYFSVTGQLHPALEENSKGQLLVATALGPPNPPGLCFPLALPSSLPVPLVWHQLPARAGAEMSVPGLF